MGLREIWYIRFARARGDAGARAFSGAMTNPRSRGAVVAVILGVLFVVPAVVSLASGDGAVCFTDSACPLSAVNPCMRKPSFAVVGRCAVAIK